MIGTRPDISFTGKFKVGGSPSQAWTQSPAPILTRAGQPFGTEGKTRRRRPQTLRDCMRFSPRLSRRAGPTGR